MSAQAKSHDLWEEAVESLGEDTRLEIDFFAPQGNADGTDEKSTSAAVPQERKAVVESLLRLSQNAQKDAANKAWSFPRKNGERVILHDVFAKIVKWIKHFETVGDIISSYDPTHIALPWAGVKVLLQIAVGDAVVHGSLVERLASISESICRNALLERMVKSSDNSLTSREELSSFLVRLYAAILVFLGMARKYYMKSTAGRIWKYGVLQSKSIDEAFGNVAAAQAQVDTCRENLNLQAVLQIHDDMRWLQNQFASPPDRWDPFLQNIQDHIDVSKRTAILRWTSDQPYVGHHNEVKKDVLQGTGQWLLQHQGFIEWKNQSASSILWLHGIPGSGKSKLVSLVIEDGLSACRDSQAPNPIYFYCSRNSQEPGRSDPAEIARCLVRQLAKPCSSSGILEPLVRLHSEREEDGFAAGRPSLKESEDLILELLSHYKDSTMTIIIDALDECHEKAQHEFLGLLENILDKSPCLLKMFLSSRDDQNIASRLDRKDRNYGSLELSSDLNTVDIKTYIRSRVDADIANGRLLRDSHNTKTLRTRIISQLQSKSKGMFRWASLQLDMLLHQQSESAIEERLGKLPRSLEALYDEIIGRIEKYEAEADRNLARNAFSWLLAARKTIPADDFLLAISYSRGRLLLPVVQKERLLDICCNLVVYDTSLDTFRFSHGSIQEFLGLKEDYVSICTNALIAEACLANIFANDSYPLQKYRAAITSGRFLQAYYTLHWPFHAQSSGLGDRFHGLGRLVERFVQDTSSGSPAERWIAGLQKIKADDDEHWQDISLLDRSKLTRATFIKPLHFALFINFDLVDLVDEQEWAVRRSMSPPNGTLEKLIIRQGSLKVLSRCLKGGAGLELGPTKAVVLAALTQSGPRWRSCLEHMRALVVDRRRVINDIVEVAARSENYGEDAMDMLLDIPEVSITNRIVRKVASNNRLGDSVMRLLFEKRGRDKVPVDESIVLTALVNPRSGDEIIALLFEEEHRHGKSEVFISKDMILAAANTGVERRTMKVLLEKSNSIDLPIDEDIMLAAINAQRYSVDFVALLFEMRGDEVPINERIMLAAVKKAGGREIMEIVVKVRSTAQIPVTENILTAAAENKSGRIIPLLRENGFPIPQHILDLDVGNNPAREQEKQVGKLVRGIFSIAISDLLAQ